MPRCLKKMPGCESPRMTYPSEAKTTGLKRLLPSCTRRPSTCCSPTPYRHRRLRQRQPVPQSLRSREQWSWQPALLRPVRQLQQALPAHLPWRQLEPQSVRMQLQHRTGRERWKEHGLVNAFEIPFAYCSGFQKLKTCTHNVGCSLTFTKDCVKFL